MNNGLGNLRIRLKIYLKRCRKETTTKKKVDSFLGPTRRKQMEREKKNCRNNVEEFRTAASLTSWGVF